MDTLQPGDIVELHFTTLANNWTMVKAAQVAYIQWRIENGTYKSQNFDVLEIQDVPTGLIITVRVLAPSDVAPGTQQASPTVLIIAAFLIGGAVGMWLAFDKAYKVAGGTGVPGPVDAVVSTVTGVSAGTLLLAAVALWWFVLRKR